MRKIPGWFLVSLMILSLPAASALADAGWPGLRGPDSNGAVHDARLFPGASAGLKVGWKRALGSGYSSVAVADGRVVTMFADGESDVVAAFDLESGDELWRRSIQLGLWFGYAANVRPGNHRTLTRRPDP